MYAQLIDDKSGTTIISASTVIKDFKMRRLLRARKTDAAKLVGETIGKLAIDKGIKDVVFDRSGYLFHGRVKSLAEGRKGSGA